MTLMNGMRFNKNKTAARAPNATPIGEFAARSDVVTGEPVNLLATVRLRERRGSAIGVCEAPPLLELGRSAVEVFEKLKQRLRDAIGRNDGTPQFVLVKRDDTGHVEISRLR